MMTKFYLFSLLMMFQIVLTGQHTFSIVAIDSLTGQVGSAGATCLTSADCGGCGGAVIISGLVRAKGAINAQAQVCIPNTNLNNGMAYIDQGNNAEETLNLLLDNDACVFGNIANRQYGIVTIDENDSVSSQAYTGSAALDHAGSRVGANYSIQGNILLGAQILDSMEARYLRSEGQSLANRLMEALQGANVPGADSRCLVDGISSKSSFLRVSKPDDPDNEHFIDLVVPFNSGGEDPIDALQDLYNVYLMTSSNESISNLDRLISVNLIQDYLDVKLNEKCESCSILVYDLNARKIAQENLNNENQRVKLNNINEKMIIVNISDGNKIIYAKKIFVK